MKSIIASFLALTAIPAFAGTYRPAPSCRTQSAALVFRSEDPMPTIASKLAVEQCEQSSATNNADCEANVVCDGPNTWENFRCSTVSAGKEFSTDDSNQSFASKLAIAECSKDGSTNNSECTSNVSCLQIGPDGGQPTSAFLCETASAGKLFQDQDALRPVALDLAVQSCQKDSATNNAECSANSDCVNPYSHRATLCETVSAGHEFSSQDLSAKIASALAIQQCQKDGTTNNSECSSNIACRAVWK